MVNNVHSIEEVWEALGEVSDPEIPVLSVLDMKIVRNVTLDGGTVSVEITPTFAGCPAMDQIQADIRAKLLEKGFTSVQVKKNLSGAWSSDMLDPVAREKLRTFGIAPPAPVHVDLSSALAVLCPHCNSDRTHIESPFGPTLCRQIFYCDSCRQSFERFKTL
ncbi:MAG: 1,2-phenylacetyl-CoA epoxidase subunit PaaD [Bacteroidota bacterium]